MRWPCWRQALLWANNKVRYKPGYEANDLDMLGTQIKFDTACRLLRPIRPAAFGPACVKTHDRRDFRSPLTIPDLEKMP
jgi:hypothetical protein